jgi:hypothetical protein
MAFISIKVMHLEASIIPVFSRALVNGGMQLSSVNQTKHWQSQKAIHKI